jgi:hypothetical protein
MRSIGRARLDALLIPCPACSRGAIRLYPCDRPCKLACALCAKPMPAAQLEAFREARR